jgi:hypothetical protein
MRIVYYCKHCGGFMGSIEAADLSPQQLGFDVLSNEEREQLLAVDSASGTTRVTIVCEHCEAALSANPELLLTNTPIQ